MEGVIANSPEFVDRAGVTVLKFGGTSVEDAAAFERVAAIVAARRDELPVVVTSAMARVTDTLVVAARVSSGAAERRGYSAQDGSLGGWLLLVRVVYDPAKINDQQLLNVFWKNVDPLTPNQQFCDRGPQYRSAICYQDAEQRRLAEASKSALERSRRFKQPIVTEVVAASRFYPAEEYHQNYYQKNPLRYKYYKTSCGRVRRLEEVWGKS